MYFTYGLAACPRYCSMIAVCGKETYFHCHDFAHSYRQPPATAVYTIDGGHRLHTVLYDIIKQHMDIYVRKPNSTRRSGADVFVYDALSAKDAQYFRSPYPTIQRSSYRKHTQVPLSSADGDRLSILMALGVADEGGVSVLVGYHKTFS